MGKTVNRSLLAVLAWACLAVSFLTPLFSSDLYPPPAFWDYASIANYSQPRLASGTSLPPMASAAIGELFVLTATPGAPVLYRREFNGVPIWSILSGAMAGGSGGVGTHSLLTHLAFADSGHTGFASSGELLNYSRLASFNLLLAEHNAHLASYNLLVASHNSHLASYNLLLASHNTHLADQIDPHGATMTVSQKMTVGSGVEDVWMERSGTGTISIASYICLVPTASAPDGVIATGTIWMDASGVLRIYDQSGTFGMIPRSVWAQLSCMESATSTTLVTQNTYYLITNATFPETVGDSFLVASAGSSKIICGANGTGKYWVGYSVSCTGNGGENFEATLFQNGNSLPNFFSERRGGANTDVMVLANFGYISMKPGDTIDVRIVCRTRNNATINVKMFQIACHRIADY